MAFPRTFRPRLEWLDERIQPAIMLDNTGGELKIFGTARADVVNVQLTDPNTIQVSISTTGEVRTFSLSQVSRIELKGGGGNDSLFVAAGIRVPSEISGGGGRDTIRGGGGDDRITGDTGDDNINGRGGRDWCQGGAGNDVVLGGNGDDLCYGGSGNDNLRGGSGRDVCNGGGGRDRVSSGLNGEVEYTAPLTGSGSGTAKFEFSANGPGEREFRVRVNGVTGSGQQLDVFVNGVRVGAIALDSGGSGELKFELDLNPDDNGHVNFPPDFPEITTGSVVTVQANGGIVLQGTFGVGSTDDNGGGSSGGGNSGSGGGGNGGGHGSDDPPGDDNGGDD